MAAFVVDVNVAITANGRHKRATALHRLACIQALRMAREGIICVDSDDHILKEYRNNLSMSGQPGPGDEFMYWITGFIRTSTTKWFASGFAFPNAPTGTWALSTSPKTPISADSIRLIGNTWQWHSGARIRPKS